MLWLTRNMLTVLFRIVEDEQRTNSVKAFPSIPIIPACEEQVKLFRLAVKPLIQLQRETVPKFDLHLLRKSMSVFEVDYTLYQEQWRI